jgi:UDP-2,4-diacetamido-2,4,6-trideoxy-beta-L-altropyranose hydrolase
VELVFRADATETIGTGHIMRCIALGQAWQDRGGKVTFVSACGEAVRNRIEAEGFDVVPVDHPCPHPSDRILLERVLASAKAPWLVIDGYHFDGAYQRRFRGAGRRVLVVDDMNHLPEYHAHILVNQNIHAPSFQYPCDPETDFLLGCRYVLLRKEFLENRPPERPTPERAKRILVTMGGADASNATRKVVQALKLLNDPGLRVKVIVGPANPHRISLEGELENAPFHWELLPSALDMPSIMAWADMAISAGGSTCWELAFMRVPFAVLVLAENQERIAAELSGRSVAENLGWHHTAAIADLSGKISGIAASGRKRRGMIENGSSIVDGRGPARIIEKMEASR